MSVQHLISIKEYFQLKLLLSEPEVGKGARHLKKNIRTIDQALGTNTYDSEDIKNKALSLQNLLNTLMSMQNKKMSAEHKKELHGLFKNLNEFINDHAPDNKEEAHELYGQYGQSFFGYMRNLFKDTDTRLNKLSTKIENEPIKDDATSEERNLLQKIVSQLHGLLSKLKEAFSTKPSLGQEEEEKAHPSPIM